MAKSNATTDLKIPANHALQLLHQSATDLIPVEVERLWALDDSISKADLLVYLRAALVQAYYAIPEYDIFAEHVRYNSLFRSFIGLKADQQLDAVKYQEVHQRWTLDQELRDFMIILLESLSELPVTDDDEDALDTCNLIDDRLSLWIDQHCPKAVYFQQFTHAPVRRFSVSIGFEESGHNVDLKTLLSEDVLERIRKTFPNEPRDSAPRFGMEERVFISSNEENKLIVHRDSIAMTSDPTHFESWEDTVTPYLTPLIETCELIPEFSLASGAMLHFGNVIVLPREVDVSDFFHMLPKLPPEVIPPRFMREQNLSYGFPTRITRSSHSTDLVYDSFGQLLRCTYEIVETSEGRQVELDLESKWTESFPISNAVQVFNELKNNAYIAFHSLITDRTRAQFD